MAVRRWRVPMRTLPSLAIGVRTTAIKWIGNAVAGFATGLVGGVFAIRILYIEPTSTFSLDISLNVVLMAGDRISRIVQPEDYDYYPVRPIGEWQPRPSDMSPHPGD